MDSLPSYVPVEIPGYLLLHGPLSTSQYSTYHVPYPTYWCEVLLGEVSVFSVS